MKNLKSMRNVVSALSLIMCIIVIIYSASVEATYFGDVNEDGKVETDDAQLINQFAVSIKTPTNRQKLIADIDQDGKITAEDARLALRTSVKLEGLKEIIPTKLVSVGNYLQFNGKSLAVYTTQSNAKNANSKGIKKYLAKGDAVAIKSIYTNVVKINDGEFIRYNLDNQGSFKVFKAPTGLKLNYTSKNINVGDTFTLKGTVSPTGAYTGLTFSSSNSKVATVDKNGLVKGMKAGTATITVKTINNKSCSCDITVKNKSDIQNNLINTARDVHNWISSNYYTYGHSGKYSQPQYMRNQREVNCISYVTWVFCEAGYVDKIYISCGDFENSANMANFDKITNPNDLQPGDIIYFAYSPGEHDHAEIYAGDGYTFNAGSTRAIQAQGPENYGTLDRDNGKMHFDYAYRLKVLK